MAQVLGFGRHADTLAAVAEGATVNSCYTHAAAKDWADDMESFFMLLRLMHQKEEKLGKGG